LPLRLAATFAKGDAAFLQIRKRKRWWKRGKFPRIPGDRAEDVELPTGAVELWRKMLPLGLIFFCASFNLTILQNLRDSIVVTAAGAEVLPFLSAYAVLPASITFFAFYARLTSSQPPRRVFYLAILPLLAVYVAFAAVLFPAAPQLHFTGLGEAAAAVVPPGLLGAVKLVENWTYSLFFCTAELWGTVVISVLFWSLANDVCSVAEAKTVYPLMGMSANVALVAAGNYIKWVNAGPAAGAGLGASLNLLVATVVAGSGLMCLAKRFIDVRGYYADPAEAKPKPGKGGPKKSKGDGKSLGDSLRVLRGSAKIRNLALLVIGYGVCHRLFEFSWKGQLRVLYPSAQEYQSILSDVSIATGIGTTVLMLCGRVIFQRLGWGAAASATPIVMFASGVAFFGLSTAAQLGLAPLGMSAAALATAGAMAGAVTQVFARSSKFSLFDPAKEMVYIEMTKEEKSKGKAAVDLIGSQIGKSGASWITQALLLTLGSISAALPVTSAVYAGVLVLWLRAVQELNGDLARFEEEKQRRKEAEQAGGGAPGSGSGVTAPAVTNSSN